MQVKRFTWSNESAVAQMDLRKLPSGPYEAIIYPPSDNKPGDLFTLTVGLAEQGFSCTPFFVDGKNTLLIEGIKKPDSLFAALRRGGFSQGQSKLETLGEKDRLGPMQWLRKHAVRMQAVTGLVGHAMNAIQGAVHVREGVAGGLQKIQQALFYGTSTSISAIHGSGSVQSETDKLFSHAKAYLQEQGFVLTSNHKMLAHEPHQRRGVRKLLSDYPLEVQNGLGALGNVSGVMGGINKFLGNPKVKGKDLSEMLGNIQNDPAKISDYKAKYEKTGKKDYSGLFDTMNGAMALTGALAVVAFPGKSEEQVALEKMNAPQQKQSWYKKLFGSIQNNPVGFAGKMALIGDFAAFASAITSKRSSDKILGQRDKAKAGAGEMPSASDIAHAEGNRKAFPFALGLAIAYLVSTGIGAFLSSKEKPQDHSPEEYTQLFAAKAAEMLVTQPADKIDGAIDCMATFLTANGKLKDISQADMVKEISQQVHALHQSPFHNHAKEMQIQQEAEILQAQVQMENQEKGALASGSHVEAVSKQNERSNAIDDILAKGRNKIDRESMKHQPPTAPADSFELSEDRRKASPSSGLVHA